jgi:hypothetical protein
LATEDYPSVPARPGEAEQKSHTAQQSLPQSTFLSVTTTFLSVEKSEKSKDGNSNI